MKIRVDGYTLNIVVENIDHFARNKQIGAQGVAMSIFKRKVNISAFPIFGMN
jgi:hypothetical protein